MPNEKLTLIDLDGQNVERDALRYFSFRKDKFVWYNEKFSKMAGLDQNLPIDFFQNPTNIKPLTNKVVESRRDIFGSNKIAVDLTPLYVLLFIEVPITFY